jgi:hypothetical protein
VGSAQVAVEYQRQLDLPTEFAHIGRCLQRLPHVLPSGKQSTILRQIQQVILDIEDRAKCAAVCSGNGSSEFVCEIGRHDPERIRLQREKASRGADRADQHSEADGKSLVPSAARGGSPRLTLN